MNINKKINIDWANRNFYWDIPLCEWRGAMDTNINENSVLLDKKLLKKRAIILLKGLYE